MAELKRPATSTREDIRQKELAEVREKAREAASIVVRLPGDRSQVPGSEARREILSRYGLTAAESAGWLDPVELLALIADHGAYREAFFIRDEFYCPSKAEVLVIAAEELERAMNEIVKP